ncbi:hypothetical protein BGZ98_008321 [Dissophora globulifera]|nr:hypothetical protein BGZ98_008321 [Dissophora globulifera]
MLVLVTPYTVLYTINQLFLHGILDKIHYLFFELIFVLAFGKIFGLPDFTERLFPAQLLKDPINIQTVEGIQPLKTNLATPISKETEAATVTFSQGILSAKKGSINMPSASSAASATGARSILTGSSTVAIKSARFQDSTTKIQGTTTDLDVSGLSIQRANDATSTVMPSTAKTLTKTRKATTVVDGPYTKELASMETKFMDYINNTEIWEKAYEDTSVMASGGTGWIQVFQFKGRPMCYKIIAYMNNTAAVTFDMLCDLDRRSDWDPMCVETRVLEEVLPPGTTIQYVRTKAVWPTASRDTVVLGTVKDLGPDKGLFMVNSSIEHSSMPERVKEKIVRMETTVAGHIITPEEGGKTCKLVQILDADLKGWIPEKVIQMVSTKAVPDGLRAINKLIPAMEPYEQSKVLAKAAEAQLKMDQAALLESQSDIEAELSMMQVPETQVNEDVDPMSSLPQVENAGKKEEVPMTKALDEDIETRHTLRRQRSEGDISLSKLSRRLRAVEAEIEMDQRLRRGQANSESRAMEKSKPTATNSFQDFWEGIKTNLGGSANKIIVAVLVVTVFGVGVAKLRRR